MEKISRNNHRIKLVRSLVRRKERAKSELCLVEGLAHVGAAFEAQIQVKFLLVPDSLPVDGYAQTLLLKAEQQNIPVFSTDADLYASLSTKDNLAGVLAVVHWAAQSLSEWKPDTHPWLAAVVAPQDPGNVGSLLRTLDAVGASGLILLDDSVDPAHPTAVRASMGSLFWVPVAHARFDGFEMWARTKAYHCYGSSSHASTDYRSVEFKQPAILLLGSEREGLSAEQSAACEELVRLPMEGRATSLNLSVAAGVLLYQMHTAFEAAN